MYLEAQKVKHKPENVEKIYLYFRISNPFGQGATGLLLICYLGMLGTWESWTDRCFVPAKGNSIVCSMIVKL